MSGKKFKVEPGAISLRMEAQISEVLELTLASSALKNYWAGHMALSQTDTHLENLNGRDPGCWLTEFLLPTYPAASLVLNPMTMSRDSLGSWFP